MKREVLSGETEVLPGETVFHRIGHHEIGHHEKWVARPVTHCLEIPHLFHVFWNDVHVDLAISLHESFAWIRPSQA